MNISKMFLSVMKVSVAGIGKAKDENKPADEKVILDLIEAIHAAEKRQFEKDTYVFSEEKRKLKVLLLTLLLVANIKHFGQIYQIIFRFSSS